MECGALVFAMPADADSTAALCERTQTCPQPITDCSHDYASPPFLCCRALAKMPVCVPPGQPPQVNAPSEVAPAGWADLVTAKEEEELAGLTPFLSTSVRSSATRTSSMQFRSHIRTKLTWLLLALSEPTRLITASSWVGRAAAAF